MKNKEEIVRCTRKLRKVYLAYMFDENETEELIKDINELRNKIPNVLAEFAETVARLEYRIAHAMKYQLDTKDIDERIKEREIAKEALNKVIEYYEQLES